MPKKLRRFKILTFGCQMNVYDSRRLSVLLTRDGWVEAGSLEEADLIFLNTCSIREKAEKKVIARLRELLPLKKANPSLILGVGGCVAEQEGKGLIQKVSKIDLVIGPRRLHEIPALLRPLREEVFPVVLAGDPQEDPLMDSLIYPRGDDLPSPLSGFITIMEGCDNFCAYCVVPYVRGRERSRRMEDILDEGRALIQNGAKEITLLGQNVNSYKADSLDKGVLPFPELLRRVGRLPGLKRLRFTTSHPKDFPKELSELFKTESTLAPHVHLPLQAGSDRILKAMGRGYTMESYLAIVDSLRAANRDISLTTDIIVGFPSETEEDFERTLAAVKSIRFDSLFSFRYSDRPQTRAQRLPKKVEDTVKSRRLEELIRIQKAISTEINQGTLGKTVEVLCDGRGRLAGQLSGRTPSNKIVHFQGEESLLGECVEVRIVRAGPVSLQGELTGPLTLMGRVSVEGEVERILVP
ncbi:MAG: tRNA (N6-isopentenyl adenosine(37)-C2)-methylthiotransferase MiaB [Deltaproteobacteria bacterium]|jgi:tRNA-2-methylthio-N6-dimethylallyladenosine synthase|nr:tRNA (N6-isopentenyl adenosine(37)-C2)-methylthiotransferase MiaB [Deltaproteobacteria bacterium]